MTALRNEPVQARSINRLASIREAARVHYDDVGRDNFNTAEVAKIAGCSIGTVYRYFEDRVSILDDIAPDRDVDPRIVQVRSILLDPEIDSETAIEKALEVLGGESGVQLSLNELIDSAH